MTSKYLRHFRKSAFTILALTSMGFSSESHANDFLNGGFDIVGPNGATVTHNNQLPIITAAANWSVWQPPGSGSALSQFVPSTNTLAGGGGSALSFVTSTGYVPTSAPGVFQSLPLALAGSTAVIDAIANPGQAFWLGFVSKSSGGFMFGDGAEMLVGTGAWQRYSFVAGSEAQSFGFELPTAGTQLIVDNAFLVSEVPEPSAAILLLFGLASLRAYVGSGSRQIRQ